MSYHQLKPEIWSHILSFLVPKLPKPMSGATKQSYAYFADEHPEAINMLPEGDASGTTIRSDIRASDLASLMRTSVEMNHHASFHLYRTVICDDLCLLLRRHDQPPSYPQIESKNQLLRRVISLHLEYGDKVDQPSYYDVMHDQRSWSIIGTISRWQKALLKGTSEVMHLTHTLAPLGKRYTTANRFPNLRRISVGAIFGGHDNLWAGMSRFSSGLTFQTGRLIKVRRDSSSVSIGQIIRTCSDMLAKLFRYSPITHFCQRSHQGPFASPNNLGLDPAIHRSTPPIITMHLHPIASVVRAASGYPTRWILENYARTRYASNKICHKLYDSLVEFDNLLDVPMRRIEVYASSSRSTPPALDPSMAISQRCKPEAEGAVMEEIRRYEDEDMRMAGLSPPKGITSWLPSWQSPPCHSCGWEYEADTHV